MATSPEDSTMSDATEGSQASMVEDISDSLLAQLKTAPFACGGSILIANGEPEDNSTQPMQPRTTQPVQIRFGTTHGEGGLVSLPIDEKNTQPLQDLLKLCTPAPFGRGKQEVLDDSYRKAVKLDPSEFASTFCPYESGIVDVVAQLLLPEIRTEGEARGVRAELYKLNVYSAPSGKFKAHVDTPRGVMQFGSLVVGLPVEHDGGQLVVRHGGKQCIYDWSSSQTGPQPAVQWAAFYSDCQHEVLEVTAGHRLTLTYNLYITLGSGLLANQPSALEPFGLPLWQDLKSALESPGFFHDGHVLGAKLFHAYAHASTQRELLPAALKGADMYIYSCAKALGLKCWIRPFMNVEYYDYWKGRDRQATLVGKKLWDYTAGQEVGEDQNLLDEVENMWPSVELDHDMVTWIRGDPYISEDTEEAALGYITYGNQPESATAYTNAALFIHVPPFAERGKMRTYSPNALMDMIGA